MTIQSGGGGSGGGDPPPQGGDNRIPPTHQGKRGTMTIDGSPSGWTDEHLIALDMANDDPRSLGDNWTMHEAPIDLTHMWAAGMTTTSTLRGNMWT